ncbi:MAG: efflux RND transporter permease subunit, partial [Gemmatimonadota bacterium]|nr:efflux RND transporter permease subunit [Gemmatimonadota bacterium]
MHAIRWTLNHPVAVFTAAATLGILAAASFAVISVELSPPSQLPELRLGVQWPGASALTVESEITRPLESLVQQLDHVTSIRSQTREGSAEIVVQFDTKANIGLLEVELNERIHPLYETMPKGVAWPVIQRSVPEELADLAGFLSYRLYGDRRPGALREYAETRMQKALLAVSGIKDVQLAGGKPLELVIEIDWNAAASAGLSSEDLAALQQQLSGGKSSLGTLRDAGTAKKVRFDGGYDNLESLKRMPIGSASVRLGDIARIYWDAPDDFSRIRINGKNSVLITIEKYPGVDLL